MRKFFSFLAVLILISCTKKADAPRIILEVGDSKINEKDFSLYLMDSAKNYNSVFLKDSTLIQQLKTSVVESLIIEELLLNWGKSEKVLLPTEEIDQLIKDQIKSYPDEQAFKRVYSELKLQTHLLRRKTQVSWIKDQLIKKLTNEVEVDPKEIKSYYDDHKSDFKQSSQIRLQQIVVKTELEAKKIFTALKKGSAFGKLASEYSLGAESSNGGVVGWVEQGTLPVFDKAFNLPLDKISSPQKSPYGYHIFLVLEKKRAQQKTLADVKDFISEKLKAEKSEEKFKQWLEKQIQKVSVKTNEEALQNLKIDVKSDS